FWFLSRRLWHRLCFWLRLTWRGGILWLSCSRSVRIWCRLCGGRLFLFSYWRFLWSLLRLYRWLSFFSLGYDYLSNALKRWCGRVRLAPPTPCLWDGLAVLHTTQARSSLTTEYSETGEELDP